MPTSTPLDAARRVSLYLVSLVAAGSADLAWRDPSPLHLFAQGTVLALVVWLSEPLTEALSSVGGAGVRRRARILAFLFVPPPTLFALVTAWAAPALAGQAAGALFLVQVGLLLVADALGLEVLALANALVLTLVAAAGGGLPAGIALCGFLVLVGVFLTLDHTAQRLSSWPNLPPPPLRLVLGEALRLMAAPVVLLALALLVLPDSAPPSVSRRGGRHAPISDPISEPGGAEARRVHQWLVLVVLAGAGSMVLALRFLRGTGSDARPLVERAESHVEAEEILEPPALDDAPYKPARGRVIRAYLRFLSRARAAGFRLGAHLTPREIEGRVRRPPDPLDQLTALFMDARYGPDEPDANDVARAEAASRVVCSSLRVVPRRGRRTLGEASGDS